MSRRAWPHPVVLSLLLSGQALWGQIVFAPGGGPALTPPPSTSKPEDRCVVQGHVSNAITGEPVRKANIRLTRQNVAPNAGNTSQGPQGYSTISQADGSFKIENIEPGNYHLSGDRAGYLLTEYGSKGVGQGGRTITLRPGQQLTNISLGLTPQGVITGKVLDQDGDPVAGAMVQLVVEMWQRGKLRHIMQNGANTNDLGEYRIANVRPGKYYLVAQIMRFSPNGEPPAEPGKPDIRPVRTFYPEATAIGGATPIQVRAGQELTGTDIRLHSTATYHIRGRIVGAIPDNPSDRITVSAAARDEQDPMWTIGGGTSVTKDRTFDIAGLAPGSYTLTVFTAGRGIRAFGRQDVEVGQADVSDVQISIVPPTTLHGQVMFEGNPPAGASPVSLKNVHVYLAPAEAMMFGGNMNGVPGDDGNFTLDNLAPGKYYLNVNAPAGTYLKSVRLGNQDILGREFDLAQGTAPISVILSYGVAELDGVVQFPQSGTDSGDAGPNGQPNATPDAPVVLVPDKLNEDGSGLRFGTSGAGGAFTMKNLPPGHYRAYALERLDFNELQNPDVLKELEIKGTDVELNQNDKKQIQLPLITTGDLQQIYTKLGIEVSQQ